MLQKFQKTAGILLLLVCCIPIVTAQSVYQPKDSIQFFKLMGRLKSEKQINSLSNGAIETAMLLLDAPYKGGTLEVTMEEALVVNLTEFDCVTLVETSVTFAEMLSRNETSFADYCRALQAIRYRNGIIDQYPSRLHYFEDWIFDNSKKGFIKDITGDIGGIPYPKKVSYMSGHPCEYEKLATNPDFVERIRQAEDTINQHTFHYIPKERLREAKTLIKTGDIIAITIAMEAMDIGHTGFAFWKDGDLFLLHASSEYKKVMYTLKPLQEYLAGNKSQTGIMVLRLLDKK
jgi:hypothetical protein